MTVASRISRITDSREIIRPAMESPLGCLNTPINENMNPRGPKIQPMMVPTTGIQMISAAVYHKVRCGPRYFYQNRSSRLLRRLSPSVITYSISSKSSSTLS